MRSLPSARTASSAPAPVSGAPQQAPAGPSSSAQPQPSPAQWEIGHLFGEFSGCAVLYNPASGQYSLYQPQLCETRFSPYSTFKIISACMGLHNGILEDENSHMRYSGAQYPVPAWNADLSLQEAFQSSCVWYFRQVIDALGQERVAQELDVPLDAMTLLPRIECIGDRELTVEGHRGILEYGETCIRLSGGSIVLNIQGQGLELTGMTPTRARVSGAIKKLCFERA